jgi:hypothetical protein
LHDANLFPQAFQEWKLSKLETKLAEMSNAALAGGYVAGAASSGGGGGGGYGGSTAGLVVSAPLARTSSASVTDAAAVQLGSNTVNLLADLDLGGGDDYAYEEGGEDDGQWSDQTIRVENKRAPPPPPQ